MKSNNSSVLFLYNGGINDMSHTVFIQKWCLDFYLCAHRYNHSIHVIRLQKCNSSKKFQDISIHKNATHIYTIHIV